MHQHDQTFTLSHLWYIVLQRNHQSPMKLNVQTIKHVLAVKSKATEHEKRATTIPRLHDNSRSHPRTIQRQPHKGHAWIFFKHAPDTKLRASNKNAKQSRGTTQILQNIETGGGHKDASKTRPKEKTVQKSQFGASLTIRKRRREPKWPPFILKSDKDKLSTFLTMTPKS